MPKHHDSTAFLSGLSMEHKTKKQSFFTLQIRKLDVLSTLILD